MGYIDHSFSFVGSFSLKTVPNDTTFDKFWAIIFKHLNKIKRILAQGYKMCTKLSFYISHATKLREHMYDSQHKFKGAPIMMIL